MNRPNAAKVQVPLALLKEARDALDMCQFMMNQVPDQKAMMERYGFTKEYCDSWVKTHTKADELAQRISHMKEMR
jgi:hypothetical protein